LSNVTQYQTSLRGRLQAVALLAGLFTLAALWQWTPLSEWVNFHAVAAWQESLLADPAAPYIIVAAYLLGSLVLFPITLLTAATILTFGPIAGNIYSLVGWLLSAALGYGLGKLLGRDWMQQLIGVRFDCLEQQATRRGLLAVIAVRVVPIAPFTIVNLFIGASGILFRDFVAGSILGRLPGILTLTLFGLQLKSLLNAPAAGNFLVLLAVVLLAVVAQRSISRIFSAAVQPVEASPATDRS
jgi:phospholipase D1/2